ncbi:hypothetical protein BDB01DRAFT_840303 [Pilobolus umbonatus]|nr:hypothetical protein BDB01DRAFT_840303 [Pilobolus umbonatus]
MACNLIRMFFIECNKMKLKLFYFFYSLPYYHKLLPGFAHQITNPEILAAWLNNRIFSSRYSRNYASQHPRENHYIMFGTPAMKQVILSSYVLINKHRLTPCPHRMIDAEYNLSFKENIPVVNLRIQ